MAFPIGTKLSNVPKFFSGSFRNYHEPGGETSQFNYFTRTPGHNAALESHRLGEIAKGTSELRTDPFDLNLTNPAGVFEKVTLYTGTRFNWTQWEIERHGPSQTNYWILRVPKKIIPGHSGIFESAIVRPDGGALPDRRVAGGGSSPGPGDSEGQCARGD